MVVKVVFMKLTLHWHENRDEVGHREDESMKGS